MKHTWLLLIKLVTCLIAFGIGLDLFFDATIIDILSFSIFVTLVSYVVGELVILPQLGRRAAAVADFLVSYLSVWIFGSFLFESYLQVAWGSIISAVLITVAEMFIHLLIQDHEPTTAQSHKWTPAFKPNLAYGTEIAEEENIKELATSKMRKDD